MITRAVLRYIRITPRKFRQIIPLVKGKRAEDAVAILAGVNKKASVYGIEVIKSAISNAKRMQGVEVSELYISNLVASGGPMLKRFRAGSMGRAGMIKKRTSHITVELDRMPVAVEAPKAKEKPAEVKETKRVSKAKTAAHNTKGKNKE